MPLLEQPASGHWSVQLLVRGLRIWPFPRGTETPGEPTDSALGWHSPRTANLMRLVQLAPVLFLLPVNIGCRDALGMNDLKFQAPPAASVEPLGTGGQFVAFGGSATGGVVTVTLPEPLPGSSMVFPSRSKEGRSLFLTYDPESGELVAYQGTSNHLTLSPHHFVPGLSHLVAGDSPRGPLLFGYARETGLSYLAYDWEDGPSEIAFEKAASSPDYTDFGHFYFAPQDQRLFAHRSDTGFFRYVSFPDVGNAALPPLTGTLPVRNGTWNLWPDALAPAVLSYDSVTRDASLFALDGDSTLLTRWTADASVSKFVVYSQPEGPVLAAYNALTGEIAATPVMGLSEGTLQWGTTTNVYFRAGLDEIWPVLDDRYCLAWSNTTRLVSLESLNPLVSSSAINIK